MGTLPPITVGWALWGKHPGASDDYSVLASSAEPLSVPEYASILAHFAPGTPPTEDNLPSSLPWVIISRVGIEGKAYIGMAIQKSTPNVDSVGRPITMTSYFCMSYSDLVNPGVSYADLYRELRSQQLPLPGGASIQLNVRRLDPGTIAARIGKEKWEPSVKAAAAMLLDGVVSIVGSEGSATEDRLAFLDAVAAMLPFGYRSDFTASTWSDSGARHQIRLAFAAKARNDAGAVRWRSDSARPAPGGHGDAYFRLLSQIRERRSGHEDLAALIGILAHETAERAFDNPQAAIDSLRGFDLPFAVLAGVREGTAQAADVRAVFGHGRVIELAPEERPELLGALVVLGDPRDVALVRKWWDTCVSGDPAIMQPSLVSACRRLVWTPAPSLGVRDYLALAAGYGMLDPVLAEVVSVPDAEAERGGGLSAAGQLLANWVLEAPSADFPLTQRGVAANPAVAGELLAQQAGSDQGTRAALAWLEPVMREFLRPFRIVLGDIHGTVDRGQLSELAWTNVNCLQALLQAAAYGGRLPAVLPPFAEWLTVEVVIGRHDNARAISYWYERIWALPVSDAGDASPQAWIDIILLILGYSPRFLPGTVLGAAPRQYAQYFAGAWSDLVRTTGQSADEQLTATLVQYLGSASWTADAQADTVVSLTMLLTSGGQRGDLESAVADAVAAVPEPARSQQAREWLARVRPPAQWDHAAGDVLDLLAQASPDLEIEAIAALCARGYSQGLRARDVCEALAESRVVTSGMYGQVLLDEVRIEVYQAPAEPRDPHEWVRRFAMCLADGTFGPQLAEEFPKAAVVLAQEEFVYRIDVLYIAITGGRGLPPSLSDADITKLEWVPKSLEQIIKEARRRPARPRIRGGKRDKAAGRAGQEAAGAGRAEQAAQEGEPGRP